MSENSIWLPFGSEPQGRRRTRQADDGVFKQSLGEPRDNLQIHVQGQLSDMAFLSTSSPAHASHLPGLDSERAKEVGHERVAEGPLRGYVERYRFSAGSDQDNRQRRMTGVFTIPRPTVAVPVAFATGYADAAISFQRHATWRASVSMERVCRSVSRVSTPYRAKRSCS